MISDKLTYRVNIVAQLGICSYCCSAKESFKLFLQWSEKSHVKRLKRMRGMRWEADNNYVVLFQKAQCLECHMTGIPVRKNKQFPPP